MTQKSFPSLVDDFLASLDPGPAMARTYRTALRQYGSFLRVTSATRYTTETVIAFRDELRKKGRRATTIQLYLVVLRRFFSWMYRQRYLTELITEGVKVPRTTGDFIKAHLSADQARALLDSISRADLMGKRDYAMISLMLTTGIRTIEVVRADCRDLGIVGRDLVLYVQGKGHDDKDAYVKITPEVRDALAEYTRAAMVRGKDPLFVALSRRCDGQRLTTRSVSRIVKTRMIDAGLDDRLLSAHSLRHTAATLNLASGGTLEETQQLLRHRAITTTVRYAHALQRAQNASEVRITSAIFGAKDSQMSDK